MKLLDITIKRLSFCLLLFIVSFSYAQKGKIEINQDKDLPKLLALKKAINTSDSNSGKYKIQIYSGNRKTAETQKSSYDRKIPTWRSTLVYETPNYKVWVGKYRTRLEADRALVKIQEEFPSAFIFKPKLKDKK